MGVAEREIKIRMSFQGGDTTASGIDRVADRADKLASAADRAQKKLDDAAAATRRLSGPRSPADAGADLANRQIFQRQARDEADQLTGRGRYQSVADQAREKVERQQRTAEVSRQARIMQGLPGEDPGRGGLGGLRDSLKGSGFARLAMPLFIAHAAGQMFEGFGKGLEDASKNAKSMEEAIGTIGRTMLQSTPIIGGFVHGLESIGRVLGGSQAAAHFATEGLAEQGRQQHVQRFQMAGQAAAEEKLYGVRVHQGDLSASAAGLGAFAESMTPEQLARYRQPHGEGLAAVDRADAQINIARARLGVREGEHATTLAGIDAMRPGVLDASRVAQDADVSARRAQGRLDQRLKDYPGQHEMWHSGLATAAVEANSAAASAGLKEIEKSKALNERLVLSQRQLADIEQSRVDLANAELAKGKALLDVKGQVAAESRGLNRSFGMHTQAEAGADLELTRVFLQKGPEALTPEQNARVANIPGNRALADKIAEDRAAKWPETQALRDLQAQQMPPELQAFKARPANEQTDEVARQMAAIEAESARKSAVAGEAFAKGAASAVTEAMDRALVVFKQELRNEQLNKSLQRPEGK